MTMQEIERLLDEHMRKTTMKIMTSQLPPDERNKPLTLERLNEMLSDLGPPIETLWMGPGGKMALEAKVISSEAPPLGGMRVYVCEALGASEFFRVPRGVWLDTLLGMKDAPAAQAMLLRGLSQHQERRDEATIRTRA